jgi:GTP pyrophosphokinase
VIKELVFLKGFAKGLKFYQTLKAINAAILLHEEHFRDDGEPYIMHPTLVALKFVNAGIKNDEILATALLHDTIEDNDIDDHYLQERFQISRKITDNVRILTFNKKVSKEAYYLEIKKHPIPLVIKIADRCHNVSTMGETFSVERLVKYVTETEKFIIPLCKYGTSYYPEYGDFIYQMKDPIQHTCKTIKAILKQFNSFPNEG